VKKANEELLFLVQNTKKLNSRRQQNEEKAAHLEAEIDEKMKKLCKYEEFEMHASQNDMKQAESMKLLDDYLREAENRKELGRMNIMRLRRLIDQKQDDIETVQMKTKATKIELQNYIDAVINN